MGEDGKSGDRIRGRSEGAKDGLAWMSDGGPVSRDGGEYVSGHDGGVVSGGGGLLFFSRKFVEGFLFFFAKIVEKFLFFLRKFYENLWKNSCFFSRKFAEIFLPFS